MLNKTSIRCFSLQKNISEGKCLFVQFKLNDLLFITSLVPLLIIQYLKKIKKTKNLYLDGTLKWKSEYNFIPHVIIYVTFLLFVCYLNTEHIVL